MSSQSWVAQSTDQWLHVLLYACRLAFCRLAPWLERFRLLWEAKAAQGDEGSDAGRGRGAMRYAALRRLKTPPRMRLAVLAASMVRGARSLSL